MSSLTQLTYLQLANTAFSNTPHSTFFGMPALTSLTTFLDDSTTSATSGPLQGIGTATSLEVLWLGNVEGQLSDELGLLSNMRELVLGGSFSGTIPDLSPMTGLTSLSLETTASLSGTIPATLTQLTYLHVVSSSEGGCVVSEAAVPALNIETCGAAAGSTTTPEVAGVSGGAVAAMSGVAVVGVFVAQVLGAASSSPAAGATGSGAAGGPGSAVDIATTGADALSNSGGAGLDKTLDGALDAAADEAVSKALDKAQQRRSGVRGSVAQALISTIALAGFCSSLALAVLSLVEQAGFQPSDVPQANSTVSVSRFALPRNETGFWDHGAGAGELVPAQNLGDSPSPPESCGEYLAANTTGGCTTVNSLAEFPWIGPFELHVVTLEDRAAVSTIDSVPPLLLACSSIELLAALLLVPNMLSVVLVPCFRNAAESALTLSVDSRFLAAQAVLAVICAALVLAAIGLSSSFNAEHSITVEYSNAYLIDYSDGSALWLSNDTFGGADLLGTINAESSSSMSGTSTWCGATNSTEVLAAREYGSRALVGGAYSGLCGPPQGEATENGTMWCFATQCNQELGIGGILDSVRAGSTLRSEIIQFASYLQGQMVVVGIIAVAVAVPILVRGALAVKRTLCHRKQNEVDVEAM